MRIAAVNWKIEPAATVDDFLAHFERLFLQCAGADLVVFPEFPCLELLADHPEVAQEDVASYLADLLQPHFPFFAQAATSQSCLLVAGTYFARTDHGIVNTAVVATPGSHGSLTVDVPKNVLTQFEKHDWNVEPGRGLRRLFDPRVGITICYDCEFPESGRALAESGVLVQCVPAFTETPHGFNRVRASCRARAIENQTIVVHASLVGTLDREPVPSTYGSSAILAPCTDPFPPDGVLAETAFGESDVALVDVDLDALHEARRSGDVRNWEDRNEGDWTVSAPTFLGSTKP